jgi:glycerophosphoryl diester phosphodiesterase
MPAPRPELRLYGHRGASAHEPENTLPAFERALADGANALELDVHLTSDRHFVIAHDPDGRRLAGEPDHIRRVALERVRRWRLRPTTGDPSRPYHVPTLGEVLESFPEVPMSIDLKPDDPHAVPDLLELLARHGAEERVILASFSTRVVRRIRGLGYPGWTALTRPEVAALRFLPAPLARRLVAGHAAQVPVRSGPVRLDGRPFVARCRRLGLRVDYWVVNDPAQAGALLDAGATGVMSDDPAAIAPVFRERTGDPRSREF